MRVVQAVLVLTACSCARWSKTDTALELAFVAEQAIDYRQTSEVVAYGGEANPVIGRWGENVSPQAYFLTTSLLHAFVSAALPRGWREAWQGTTILWQGYIVESNRNALGKNMDCPARLGTADPCSF